MKRILQIPAGLLLLFFVSSVTDARAEMDEVEKLLQQERIVEASQLVDSRLMERPDDLALRELRLDLRVGMGFGAGEVARLDEAVKAEPGDVDAWYLLGRALLDVERSRAAYEQAIRLDPAHARSWMGQGSLQELDGDCEQAVESYAHALTLQSDLHEAWVSQIRCRVALEDLSGARSLAEGLIRDHPETAAGWLTMAALDVKQELEYLERALEQRPEDQQLMAFLLEAALTQNDLETALWASQRLEDAGDAEVRTTRGLLLELEEGVLDWDVLEEVLNARGSGLSVARAAVLVAERSDSSWMKLIYARTLWARGELLSAETLLTDLTTEIAGGDAHQSLGMLYMSSSRPADAAEVLLSLTEIRPQDLEAQVLLTMSLVEAGQLPVARGHLEQLLETHPLDRGLRYTHAYLLMVQQENAQAVEACQFYLKYWPDEGVATWLAGAALRLEAKDGAKKTLQDLESRTGNQAYRQLASQL